MKLIKFIIIFILFLPCLCSAGTINVLIIGQSNAAGRAPILDGDTHLINGVYILDGEVFRVANSPLNQYSTIKKDFDQGLSFAHTLLEKLSVNNNVNIIVNARGGSNIESWTRGGENYDPTIELVNSMGLKIDVIFMHQGEADRKDINYPEKLAYTIRRFRKDLNSECPFIIGEIAETASDSDEHNERLLIVPTLIHSVGVVSSDNLTTIGDYHFDNASQKRFGRRYYEKYLFLFKR